MFDRQLKILLVSSEVVPFAKTGGLADVAGSLPKALSTVGAEDVGNDVRVAMPKYKDVEDGKYLVDFPVEIGGHNETCIIRETGIDAQFNGRQKRISVYLVDNYHYFYRDGMYMFDDDAERFIFFCRSVLEMLEQINWQPDIIHCNDWQTGAVPFLLKTHYRNDDFYNKIVTVFTIHNLQYQGNFSKQTLKLLGVGDDYFRPELLEFYGSVSLIKTGILYADVVNTVSRTYAREIQTAERGERMDGVLRMRSRDLYGILNGINYHEFNPQTDPRIHRNYDQNNLHNKKENKFALQKEMGLTVRDIPVIGLISRLVDQKGLDLLAEIVDDILKMDIQLVVLGSGDEYYENLFKDMKKRHPEKMGLYIGFNSILAQRIYAGSDMFLMPSRFEPCGLGQLISLRYGTIPIVRFTGGLADTVREYDYNTGTGNGFIFRDYSGKALQEAIGRALRLYSEEPERWKGLVKNAMELDFSWARSAVEYLQLYQEAMQKHRERLLGTA